MDLVVSFLCIGRALLRSHSRGNHLRQLPAQLFLSSTQKSASQATYRECRYTSDTINSPSGSPTKATARGARCMKSLFTQLTTVLNTASTSPEPSYVTGRTQRVAGVLPCDSQFERLLSSMETYRHRRPVGGATTRDRPHPA